MKLKAPDDAEVVLTIYATVGELRRLRQDTDDVKGNWSGPMGSLRDQLRSVISQAETSWAATETKPEGQS